MTELRIKGSGPKANIFAVLPWILSMWQLVRLISGGKVVVGNGRSCYYI